MPEKKDKIRRILLRHFLIFSILGATLGLIVFIAGSYNLFKNVCFKNLASIRDQQAQLIDAWFQERDEEIKQLSQCAVVREKNLPELRKLFKERLSWVTTGFEGLAFADQDGLILIEGEEESLANSSPVSIADREYYRLALEGKSYFSETVISRLSGKFTSIVSNPVFSAEGEIIGVMIGSLNLAKLERLISFWDIGKTGGTYLIDKNGMMIMDPYFTLWSVQNGIVDKTGKYCYQLKTGVAKGLSRGENGYGEYDNHQQTRVFGAYKGLENYDWGLAVEIDKAEMLQPFREKVFLIVLLFVLLFIFIIYPLARLIVGKIVWPLEQTAKKTTQYAENCQEGIAYQFSEDKHSYEEIGAINQAFGKLSQKINGMINTLRVQALYDPLTGLANRRHFFARGQEIIELVRRNDSFCSLIYFDIDGFKKINDRYGNTVGDQVLVHIAEVLGKITRISDVAGRLGGEEFAIILPETDEKGAQQFAERVRKYVEEIPVEVDYQSFHITISVGAATFKCNAGEKKGSSELLEILINQSDKAMYKAKEKGGNSVELYCI